MNSVTEIENDWEDFKIPVVTENDYGLEWPTDFPQLAIELQGFRHARMGVKIGQFESAFNHGLRIIQLLWTDELASISRMGALNTYFLDVFKDLCEFEDLAITGPASSAKTYTMSIFFLICFYAAPDKTSVLISTTSKGDSERRVWADIKKLHRNARFDDNSMPEPGEVIEHYSCIVYNPAKIAGKDFNIRDFRNGIIVVPTGGDSTGDEAMAKIQGTKNNFVYWGIDEGTKMPTNIMAPRGNLVHNPYAMFVMVGNASKKTDPHGRACEPLSGYGSIDANQKRWRGKTLNVLFLHGERGPNDIYFPDAKKQSDLPYPSLCNKFGRLKDALLYGNGDLDLGVNTQDYWTFAIGFWMGSDDSQTCLSEGFVKSHNADRAPDKWGVGRVRVFGACDPGFAAGGDANAVMFMHLGYTIRGKVQLHLESASIEIRPRVADRKEYAAAVGEEVVRLCKERGCQPQDFAVDVSADGGITGQAIENAWGLGGIQLLSSLAPSTADKFANRVSQFWMGIRDLIGCGYVCGFNCNSNYAKDLFERRYTNDNRTFKVEKKKDTKKRLMRSPDNGDAFSYCSYLVSQSGILDITEDRFQIFDQEQYASIKARYFTYNDGPLKVKDEEDEFAGSYIGDDD